MAAVSFKSIDVGLATHLVAAQRNYSSDQRRMAIESPHLLWVNPPNKGLPKKLRLEVLRRSGPYCRYCGVLLTETSFTVDHRISRKNGGTDDLANLTVACRPCNSRKGAENG